MSIPASAHPAATRPLVELVAGARPNFVKLAPVVHALRGRDELAFRIVHTGQHYDASMSDVFFEQLDLPEPDVHLGVGSASHGAQTGRLLEAYERHLMGSRPDGIVVFGDVNSTVACALAAVKLGIPVAHVEAGLRSFDRTMPEEINRILTDAIADLLLVSEPSGMVNLAREGIDPSRTRLVGNVMIDTLKRHLPAAQALGVPRSLGLDGRAYGFVTMHRPSNVDDPAVLERLLDLFQRLGRELPIVFAVHPRTAAQARAHGLADRLAPEQEGLITREPLPYLEALSLVASAAVVFTDSGGLQEETSVLGVPCLTMRENTERPVTIEHGTSRLVGNDVARIEAAFRDVREGRWPASHGIPLWDGQTGVRIGGELVAWLGRKSEVGSQKSAAGSSS